ncbi:transglycosylase SLT domain-containing protein [Streptomyces gamaensis]|uniref:Transglycosylase SLT domain-containing protein n=1 Tax=Streptomyces gamaensis TaxID=1763542 RepID=A0ABW0Z0S1_9ACTN
MRSTISGSRRLSKVHMFSAAGIAAAGVATVAFAVVPAGAEDKTRAVSVKPVAWNTADFGTLEQQDHLNQQADNAARQAKAEAEAKKKAEDEAAAKAKADKERAEKEAASRSEERAPLQAAPAAPAKKVYANNLDGWIREALDVMQAKGIPGSYNGIYRNIMRESTGNPQAINLWDSNAAKGIPSKGLLQVIDPTFKAYHVEGTSWDIYDPVANITAACNYAAKVYGSMDNVNSAY